ncbi:MAG: hypothetical protein H0T55_04695 [Rubrobacteraceae bacterium]|jgi:hypothetical protein|nr:hypothetical protein [Rubrobacteraceae bacterium]MBA3616143.1 hypothetical protein [Rubrobacteraceae bacterium]
MTSKLDGIVGACGAERKQKRQDSCGKMQESTRKTFIEAFGGYVSASGSRQGGDKSRR